MKSALAFLKQVPGVVYDAISAGIVTTAMVFGVELSNSDDVLL